MLQYQRLQRESTVRFVRDELGVYSNNPGGRTRQRGPGVVNPSRRARYFEGAAISVAADPGLEPSMAEDVASRVKGKGKGRGHGQSRNFGKQKGKGRGKGGQEFAPVQHSGKGPPHSPWHQYNPWWDDS